MTVEKSVTQIGTWLVEMIFSSGNMRRILDKCQDIQSRNTRNVPRYTSGKFRFLETVQGE